MSNASTPPAKDEALLDIGKKCSYGRCGMVDFLPFKCEHCAQPFCAEHFRVEEHQCSHYDSSKHDRVAPHCPLCDEPIAIPPGQDPTIRFQDHVDTKCPVTTGRKPGSSSPRCANRKCNKVLISPIRCDKCRKQFCPPHRFPSDHTCVPPTSARPTVAKPSVNVQAANLKKTASEVSDTIGTKANAASAAIKRSMVNAHTPKAPVAAKPTNSSSSTSSPSIQSPFSKTNRPPLPSSPIILNVNASPPTVSTIKPPSPTITQSILDPNSFVPRSIFATA
jgi:predicted nucleic acid binding AN1-type Zn finger protein